MTDTPQSDRDPLDDDLMYRVEQVSVAFDVHPSTTWRAIRKGELKVFRPTKNAVRIWGRDGNAFFRARHG
jgi:hypothetical protein